VPRVLAVDDDPVSLATLTRMLTEAGVAPVTASGGGEALKLLGAAPHDWIVLLDLFMPQPDGQSICQILRARFGSGGPYIIGMSSRATRAAVASTLRAGADDFLPKPIAPDVLRSRLSVARRHLGRGAQPSQSVVAGLDEGAAGGSGELIVRDDDSVGRVLFHEGNVAWAHISEDSESFVSMLLAEGVQGGELKAAVDEARRRGEGFAEVVLAWGLLDRDALERVSKAWIQRRLFSMLRFKEPRVLFVPTRRPARGTHLSFALADVLPREVRGAFEAGPVAPSVPPPTDQRENWERAFLTSTRPTPAAESLLSQAMQIEGTISAAVVDRFSGVCDGWKGQVPDPGALWGALQSFGAFALAEGAPEEMLISTPAAHYLVRPLGNGSARLCFLVVDRRVATLGASRAAFAALTLARS
jgi:CheY-like chemotaxis protein